MSSNNRVTIGATGESFEVAPREFILDAAIRQQASIPYSCRNGTCRTCISTVVEGSVEQHDTQDCLISPSELAAGQRLICLATADGDVIIEPLRKLPKKQTAQS
ncbi:CDP-4-dehydro-6-deoxyglucose reductase/phenol hydroxylase P5 protein [Paenibacillus taihuensis]|uniref:CDP-4-dehydro-6-deoxyglucose reductase/phenol hydroxylase P5 protein n=1 Tax=Paenibacillus taihuensis TaxID=1156355 RepID=A0A3D9S1R7_9BACL|nr:2Fe-2S iron-sulfur cluster-binding protein [Paenibacillus taihuensis]REE86550.1 CDP-4-dehydro-6-deoxyglucose reductase/phenol hydroxylase P5 protein [Paenibacillus taihuensis]